jgi:predicted nucleic acid-binding protein
MSVATTPSTVLLDSNVLLIGGLSPLSNAVRLIEVRGRVRFVVSNSILDECRKVIEREAPSREVAAVALRLLGFFLAQLGAEAARTTASSTAHDQHVLEAAAQLGADVICTYNVRDFDGFTGGTLSPLGLLREVDFAEFAVERPNLGGEWTLLLRGQVHNVANLGSLVRGANGVEVYSRDDAKIEASGPGVNLRVHHPLPARVEFSVVIRYSRSGQMEVDAWPMDLAADWPSGVPADRSTGKLKLSSGSVPLVPPVGVFCFNYPSGFVGEVYGFSSAPLRLSDRRLRNALPSGTLESALKSEDVRALLGRIQLDERAPHLLTLEGKDVRTRTVNLWPNLRTGEDGWTSQFSE